MLRFRVLQFPKVYFELMTFKKAGPLFFEKGAPGKFQPLVAIQTLLLTLQALPWLVKVLQRPYAWFGGARLPIWVSLVG